MPTGATLRFIWGWWQTCPNFRPQSQPSPGEERLRSKGQGRLVPGISESFSCCEALALPGGWGGTSLP